MDKGEIYFGEDKWTAGDLEKVGDLYIGENYRRKLIKKWAKWM